jgi:hypothetical protein
MVHSRIIDLVLSRRKPAPLHKITLVIASSVYGPIVARHLCCHNPAMTDYNQILKDKEAALAFAKEQVAILEAQVKNLRASLEAASVKSEFELLLIHKRPTSESGAQIFTPRVALLSDAEVAPVNLGISKSGDDRQRNPKGSIRALALAVLLDGGTDKTLDEIDRSINLHAIKPVSRNSIRTLMMNLKREGLVMSPTDGVFRFVVKGEAPANSRSAEASSATESSGS